MSTSGLLYMANHKANELKSYISIMRGLVSTYNNKIDHKYKNNNLDTHSRVTQIYNKISKYPPYHSSNMKPYHK